MTRNIIQHEWYHCSVTAGYYVIKILNLHCLCSVCEHEPPGRKIFCLSPYATKDILEKTLKWNYWLWGVGTDFIWQCPDDKRWTVSDVLSFAFTGQHNRPLIWNQACKEFLWCATSDNEHISLNEGQTSGKKSQRHEGVMSAGQASASKWYTCAT